MTKKIIALLLVIATMFAMSSIAFSASAATVKATAPTTQALKPTVTKANYFITNYIYAYRHVARPTGFYYHYVDQGYKNGRGGVGYIGRLYTNQPVYVLYKTNTMWVYCVVNGRYGWVYAQDLKY